MGWRRPATRPERGRSRRGARGEGPPFPTHLTCRSGPLGWSCRPRMPVEPNLGTGIDSLAVAELMKEAGLTHGAFYRHFDSREQLVAEAAQRALSQGSARTIASGKLAGARGKPPPWAQRRAGA